MLSIGLIIRGTLIKIELQHSASNTMTFIITTRQVLRANVLVHCSAFSFSFLFLLLMSSRLVRCTNAGIMHDVVRHFFLLTVRKRLSEEFTTCYEASAPLPSLLFLYQASEYELHLFDFNDLRFIVTRLSTSLATKFKNS